MWSHLFFGVFLYVHLFSFQSLASLDALRYVLQHGLSCCRILS